MRRMEFIIGSLLWLAAATLMPMAALEPIQSAQGSATPAAAAQP